MTNGLFHLRRRQCDPRCRMAPSPRYFVSAHLAVGVVMHTISFQMNHRRGCNLDLLYGMFLNHLPLYLSKRQFIFFKQKITDCTSYVMRHSGIKSGLLSLISNEVLAFCFCDDVINFMPHALPAALSFLIFRASACSHRNRRSTPIQKATFNYSKQY